MIMPQKPVDTQITVIVGQLWDDTDYKTRETAITYDQAGMDIDIILEKHDGTIVTTAVTLADSGDYLWTHEGHGYYSIVLPASEGASFSNTEEGILRVVGYCNGVLPFGSVAYEIIPTAVYNALVKGTTSLIVDGTTAILAMTGVTAGGTYTFAECMKIIMAALAGTVQDKTGEATTKQYLDLDDGTTVVIERVPAGSTPYRSDTKI